MSFESEFYEFMKETVLIERFLYMNAEKEKVYDDPVRFQARVAGKSVSVRRSEKEEFQNIVDIWINPEAGKGGTRFTTPMPSYVIDENSRITLESGVWADRNPVIFGVGRYTDDEGQHNVKIQCGWMYHRQGQ